jgi:GNAT superfamily N-acetyltransferase
MEIRRVREPWELAAVHYLRIQVALNLNIPPQREIDEKPGEAVEYLLILDGDVPVATGRLRVVEGKAKFERITVAVARQGQGLGRRLMRELEAWARDKGLTEAYLTGKAEVENFYLRIGYATDGPVSYAGTFPLVRMTKSL